MQKTGPSSVSKPPVSGAIDARADEVRRHEVGGELEALELAAERVGERLDGQRLGQAGHAFEEHVPAGQQRHEQPLEHRLLADDDPLDLEHRRLERGVRLARRLVAGVLDRPQADVVRHAIRVRGPRLRLGHWAA